MFGAILKATNSSFQKCMTFCHSIYVKKVMKLLAFIFEQPSYLLPKDNIFKNIFDSDIGIDIVFPNRLLSNACCIRPGLMATWNNRVD